jgi:hypothetical protein
VLNTGPIEAVEVQLESGAAAEKQIVVIWRAVYATSRACEAGSNSRALPTARITTGPLFKEPYVA